MQKLLDCTLLIDQKQGQSANFIKQLTVLSKSTYQNIKSVDWKTRKFAKIWICSL